MESFMGVYNAFWHIIWLCVALVLYIAGAFSAKTAVGWGWDWPWKAVKGLFKFIVGMIGIRF